MKVTFALPLALAALAASQEYATPGGEGYATPSMNTPSVASSSTPSATATGSTSLSQISPSVPTPHVSGTGPAWYPHPIGTAVGTGGATGGSNGTMITSTTSRTVSAPSKPTQPSNPSSTPPADNGAMANVAPVGLGMGVAGALFAAFL